MESFLSSPLPSGFLDLTSERPQQEVRGQNEKVVPFPLAGPSQAVGRQWIISLHLLKATAPTR